MIEIEMSLADSGKSMYGDRFSIEITVKGKTIFSHCGGGSRSGNQEIWAWATGFKKSHNLPFYGRASVEDRELEIVPGLLGVAHRACPDEILREEIDSLAGKIIYGTKCTAKFQEKIIREHGTPLALGDCSSQEATWRPFANLRDDMAN